MYGDLDRQSIPVLKAIDDAFIEGTTKEFGSRKEASRRAVAQGFRYYFQGDLSTAMKRFNQGWLLNPSNPGVFYGYASVLNDQEKFCAGREMITRALNLGLIREDLGSSRNAESLADSGRLNALCAMLDNSLTADRKNSYLKQSYNYYVDALKLSPNSAYVYGSWASADYWRGNYLGAWENVRKQRELGGKPGSGFLQLLNAKMPEPINSIKQ